MKAKVVNDAPQRRLALVGDIAFDGKPKVHAHAVLRRRMHDAASGIALIRLHA